MCNRNCHLVTQIQVESVHYAQKKIKVVTTDDLITVTATSKRMTEEIMNVSKEQRTKSGGLGPIRIINSYSAKSTPSLFHRIPGWPGN